MVTEEMENEELRVQKLEEGQEDCVDDEEEDDFGDFEEGEIEEHEQVQPSSPEGEGLTKTEISTLLNKIFPSVEMDECIETEFKFDERSEQLFENLLNTEEYPLQQMIWKQSMILRQLFLNLDIPIADNTFKSRKKYNKVKVEYDDLKLDTQLHLQILNQSIDFKQLGIEKSSEEFNDILFNTDEQLGGVGLESDEIYENLNEDELNRKLQSLLEIKQQLLKTLTIWNEQFVIVKEDNELFTSYIENLVGNTQKLRRINK